MAYTYTLNALLWYRYGLGVLNNGLKCNCPCVSLVGSRLLQRYVTRLGSVFSCRIPLLEQICFEELQVFKIESVYSKLQYLFLTPNSELAIVKLFCWSVKTLCCLYVVPLLRLLFISGLEP
jgi:hypothetical protein